MSQDPEIRLELRSVRHYPAIFSEEVFDQENPTLVRALDRLGENRIHRAMVFIDSAVADLNPLICQQISQYFEHYCDDIELAEEPRIIPGGEVIKNDLNLVGPLISAMVDAHLCRHSYAVVVGGGSVLDSVGLAASLVHRGIRVVRIPTTLFAQINAGLSLKYGINLAGRKDGAGTFAPPFAVINDWRLLDTLPDNEWQSGLVEAFRLALLFDPEFYDELCRLAPTLNERRSEDVQHIIERAASITLEQISARNDLYEEDAGHPLNFALWSAYRMEMSSGNEITHGEALGVGILLDTLYAVIKGWFPEEEFRRLLIAFGQIGIPLWTNQVEMVGDDGYLDLFHGISDFQEHLGGQLQIVFPTAPGESRVEHEIDFEVLEQALARLKTEASHLELELQPH